MADSNKNVFTTILTLLEEKKCNFTLLNHDPTYNSSESDLATTGSEKRIGGKALVIKIEQTCRLFVINSALKLDLKKIKAHFNVKRLRLATKEELLELTGLVPGCIPPFGRPILPFDIYCDSSVFLNDKISFNAGSLTDSIIMNTLDWKEIAQPNEFEFAEI